MPRRWLFIFASALFLHRAGQGRDVVVDEQRVENRDRQRAEQRTRHQRAPLIDVAGNQFGQDRDRHGFVRAALDRSGVIVSLRLWNIDKVDVVHRQENLDIIQLLENEFEPGFSILEELKPGRGLKLRERLFINSDFEFKWPSLCDDFDNTKGFCYALRDQLAILVDGTAVPCCLDGEGVINLGNVFEQPLSSILAQRRVSDIYNGFSNHNAVEPLCRKCRYKDKFD